jgi:hypothetical protein
MAKGPQRFLDAAGHAIRKVTVWTSGDEVDVATSPVILSGSGVPGATVPNGSIYLRTNGDAYIRTGDAWVTTELAPGDFGAGPLLVDVIDESTGAAGVTVDGVLIKDGGVILADAAVLEVDTINEATAAAGVTVDGVLLKDGGAVFADGAAIDIDTINEATAAAGVTVDGVLLKDGGAVFADGASIEIDTIDEATAAAGVTIDGVLIKDSRLDVSAALTGVAGLTLTDNLASAWDVKEAANVYLTFVTTNDAERITAGKLLASPVQAIDMADAAVALVYGTAGAGEVKITGQALFVDPNSGGASEVLTLPPEATSVGVVLDIFNTGGESIAVEDDAAGAVLTIPTGKAGRVACNGTIWLGLLGA